MSASDVSSAGPVVRVRARAGHADISTQVRRPDFRHQDDYSRHPGYVTQLLRLLPRLLKYRIISWIKITCI